MPHFPQKRAVGEREKTKWGTRDGMDLRACAVPRPLNWESLVLKRVTDAHTPAEKLVFSNTSSSLW